jgi:hypothetical protein
MRAFGVLENPVDYTLGVYFHHCAIAMSCRQLALAGRYLVHHGRNPATKGSVVSAALTLLSAPTRCGDRLEFDTSRFESWHPSQSPWSLPGNFGCWRKYGPFRGLEGKDPVSRQEFWRNRTESRESRGESLHDGFSISENWIRGRPETGCVSAETGSNPHGIGGRVVESLVKVRGRPISDAVDEADGSSRHVAQAAALGALLAAGRDACRDCLSCHMRKPVMPNKSGRNPDKKTSTVQIGPKP